MSIPKRPTRAPRTRTRLPLPRHRARSETGHCREDVAARRCAAGGAENACEGYEEVRGCECEWRWEGGGGVLGRLVFDAVFGGDMYAICGVSGMCIIVFFREASVRLESANADFGWGDFIVGSGCTHRGQSR